MQEKKCTKCGINKFLDEFHCSKRCSDGRIEMCKKCKKDYCKNRYQQTAEKHKAYNDSRAEKRKSYDIWWRGLSKPERLQLKIDRAISIDNKVAEKKILAAREKENKDFLKIEKAKQAELKRLSRPTSEQLKEAARKKRAELYRFKYHNDPIFKLKEVLKKRTQKIFKRNGWATPERCGELLGADFETVKTHIESLFEPGMTWDNHGFYGWHIDHRHPLDSAKDECEVYPLFHYTNLQPLWAIDNMRKHNKLVA